MEGNENEDIPAASDTGNGVQGVGDARGNALDLSEILALIVGRECSHTRM
jgi:hypothetical protein